MINEERAPLFDLTPESVIFVAGQPTCSRQLAFIANLYRHLRIHARIQVQVRVLRGAHVGGDDENAIAVRDEHHWR